MKLAISGSGGCGKDTVCKWFNDNTSVRYHSSTSWYTVNEVFARMKDLGIEYPSLEECYKDRDSHRQIWADIVNIINDEDKTTLYRRCLDNQDILNGIRNKDQLIACKSANLVDLVIWIDRDVKNDPTMGYGPELCDIVIPNKHDVHALCNRLSRLAKCLKIGVVNETSPSL